MPMPVIGMPMSPLPCCSEADCSMAELSVRGGGAVACSAAVKLCVWQSVGTVHQ